MSTPDYRVELARRIHASAAQAYDALTDPASLSRWFTERAEAELEVGGRYSNSDRDRGEFLVLERPTRVRFTWENEKHCPDTIVEIRLREEDAGGVRVELEHSRIRDEAGYEDMKTGWSWALDSLKSYLETGSPIPYETWEKARGDT